MRTVQSNVCEVYVFGTHSALKNWCYSYYLLRDQDQMMEIQLVPLQISSSVNILKETQVTLLGKSIIKEITH